MLEKFASMKFKPILKTLRFVTSIPILTRFCLIHRSTNHSFMKQLLTFLFCLPLLMGSLAAQTIFVAGDATGANDGSSWADAYTSLDAALGAAEDGNSIWVKTGTYVPDSTFTVSDGINLLGGFAGTETSADGADPVANVTILSGDVNGDDDPDQIDANRSDNVRILAITEGTASVTIAGFTFANGQLASGAPTDFSGAGILTLSPVTIANCIFTGNVADYGAAISLLGAGMDLAEISNVTVNGNVASARGVIYSEGAANISVDGSSFDGNFAGRGAVYFVESENVSVTNSDFTNNTGARSPAIGYFTATPGYIGDCTFTNNTATGEGGAIYLFSGDNTTRPADAEDYIIENSTFDGNTATGSGGTIFCLRVNSTIRNCTFTGSETAGRGGVINYSNGDVKRAQVIENCQFTGNNSTSIGTVIYLQNKTDLDVTGCSFVENGDAISSDLGAICYLGNFDSTEAGVAFVGEFNVDNSQFIGNQSSGNSGAINIQNNVGNVIFNVTNSRFEGNFAFAQNNRSGLGGAITTLPGVISSYDNCVFQFNEATFGGAIAPLTNTIDPLVPRELGSIEVTNSQFVQNGAITSGGSIYAEGMPKTFINNVFAANLATFGGAIYMTTDSLLVSDNTLINNTFYSNIADGNDNSFADDVVIFETDGAEVTVTLQNNAFISEGINANFEFGGEPEMTSLGGNYYLQEPVEGAPFDEALDFFDAPDEITALFIDPDDDVDPEGRDFRLRTEDEDGDPIENPLVDMGTTGDLVPGTDLLGGERDATPDIGAYEAGAVILPTVAEIVIGSPVHTTLETLLGQANLVETLQGEGTFTVFAPTDAAFSVVPQEVLDLLGEGDNLTNVLLTHVLGFVAPSSAVTDGLVAPSLAPGTNLSFTNDGAGVITVTTEQSAIATVTMADLMASNGVVHVIDAVLVPAIVAVTNFDGAGVEVTFFPNPVQNQMNVRIDDASITEMNISVINLNGQRVNNWNLGNGNNVIDFTSVPAGTYTLEIELDGATYSKQVVKQ